MENDLCFQHRHLLVSTKAISTNITQIKVFTETRALVSINITQFVSTKTRACLGLQQFERSASENEEKRRRVAVSPSSSPISRFLKNHFPLYQGFQKIIFSYIKVFLKIHLPLYQGF